MKKLISYIFLIISFSSCFKTYEAISNVLTKDKDCWIDTRSMILYYNGPEVMNGISIRFYGQDSLLKPIDYQSEPGQKSIDKVDLTALREKFMKQTAGIFIDRDSVHWRDRVSFYIEPEDWEKKRRITSTHTHH